MQNNFMGDAGGAPNAKRMKSYFPPPEGMRNPGLGKPPSHRSSRPDSARMRKLPGNLHASEQLKHNSITIGTRANSQLGIAMKP